MRFRSLATLIAFFFLAAMISHSMTSTIVLGVTPLSLSKLGVVAHPAVINDAKRSNTKLRMTIPPDTQRAHCISSMSQDRCVGSATDWQFSRCPSCVMRVHAQEGVRRELRHAAEILWLHRSCRRTDYRSDMR